MKAANQTGCLEIKNWMILTAATEMPTLMSTDFSKVMYSNVGAISKVKPREPHAFMSLILPSSNL